MINLHPENGDFPCVFLFAKEFFAKPSNPAMTIFSRRYLSACEHVIKYLMFAGKDAGFYVLRGINPKCLSTEESGGISL